MNNTILVINPGSTSTKVAIYKNGKLLKKDNIKHPIDEIKRFNSIIDQLEFRLNIIKNWLKEHSIDPKSLDAVVARGGLLKPIQGGTYKVNEKMIEDLEKGVQGEHASNLGGIIAYRIAQPLKIPAFIVDPVVVDEMDEIAKVTGLPEIKRRSIFHALNQKQVARRAAKDLGKEYEETNLIVVHLGGGISIGMHKKGKVVDVNNALDGDGPFAPERAGSLPVWDTINLVINGKYTISEWKKKLAGKGGIVAHLGTNDMREVEERVKKGDKRAEFIYKAMAYNVAKWIGMMAPITSGNIDAIVLTGGLAYDRIFVSWIEERVSFIAKVLIYPGEDEMQALMEGALRVLKKEEDAKIYK